MMRFARGKWFYPLWLMLNDSILIYGSFRFAYELRFFYHPFLALFPATKGVPPWQLYQEALRTVIPIWLLIFALWGKLYQIRFSDAADDFLSVFKSATLATLLVIAITFLYRRYEYSRLVIAFCWLISSSALFLSREFWKIVLKAFYEQIGLSENLFLIAQGKIADTVAKLIQKNPHRNLTTFSEDRLDEVKEKISSDFEVEEVIIQGQFLNNPAAQELVDACEDRGIEIKILPEFLEMRLGELLMDNSLGIPILHLKPLSLHGFRFWMKRTFDVSVSILIVSLFFIPFLIAACLILLDSKGGIFFRQERIGFKEKKFNCLKFRTMHKNAESLLEEWNLASFRGGPAFKMRGDPRITRMGRWLRKFSLDECAQIWNVLKGEMSLIGPRPQVLAEANGNPDWARKRYRILPGITGLWQVSGRADLSYEDMMRLDIYYLENWSPGLDLRIILKTIPVVLSGKGAY